MLASSIRALRSERALRVIPRGKQRLTVYRAHQVAVNLVSEKSGEIEHKSEDISGSVNRFDSGAISPLA